MGGGQTRHIHPDRFQFEAVGQRQGRRARRLLRGHDQLFDPRAQRLGWQPVGIVLQRAFAGHAHGGQFLQSAKPAEQRTFGQPPAQPAIILAEQAAQHIAPQSLVTVPLVAGAGLGGGGGKLPVVTREALFDK